MVVNLKQDTNLNVERRSPYSQFVKTLDNSIKEGYYEDTIGESKEESVSQTVNIMLREMQSAERRMREHINRPEVNLKKGIFITVLMLAIMIGWILVSKQLVSYIPVERYQLIMGMIFLYIVVFTLSAKSIVIWLVKVYQRYAPAEIRLSCRFEPTCSQYMLMAIDKYGIVHGLVMGLRRLSRCHPPNGGEDYP